MKFNELIREVLFQMFQSGAPNEETLKRLDANVLNLVKEGWTDEKGRACRSGDGSAKGK